MSVYSSYTTGADSASASQSSSLLQQGAVLLFGVVILFGVGFLPMEAVHNAAHDTRHSFVFPCH